MAKLKTDGAVYAKGKQIFEDSTAKIRQWKTCKFLLPKIFLLFWRKITQILPDYPHGHQSTPSPPKAVRHAVQLPLQQKNHHANLHTVAASLRTVVYPPVAF